MPSPDSRGGQAVARKTTKNLAKIPTIGQQPAQIATTADAAVQVDKQREDVLRAWEAAAAL